MPFSAGNTRFTSHASLAFSSSRRRQPLSPVTPAAFQADLARLRIPLSEVVRGTAKEGQRPGVGRSIGDSLDIYTSSQLPGVLLLIPDRQAAQALGKQTHFRPRTGPFVDDPSFMVPIGDIVDPQQKKSPVSVSVLKRPWGFKPLQEYTGDPHLEFVRLLATKLSHHASTPFHQVVAQLQARPREAVSILSGIFPNPEHQRWFRRFTEADEGRKVSSALVAYDDFKKRYAAVIGEVARLPETAYFEAGHAITKAKKAGHDLSYKDVYLLHGPQGPRLGFVPVDTKRATCSDLTDLNSVSSVLTGDIGLSPTPRGLYRRGQNPQTPPLLSLGIIESRITDAIKQGEEARLKEQARGRKRTWSFPFLRRRRREPSEPLTAS